MNRGVGIVLAALLLSAAPQGRDSAQQLVWQADVSIRAFGVNKERASGLIAAHVVVSTDSGDARAARLEVMLPVGVGLLGIPESCQASPSRLRSLNARVTCTLGDLAVHEYRDITITTTSAPKSRGRLRFAVFVFSDTPDPLPANNFAERVVP